MTPENTTETVEVFKGNSTLHSNLSQLRENNSFKIGILEKLAVCFVTILIPASALAGLFVIMLASQSSRTGSDKGLYSIAVPEKRALGTLL
jgi:hypothetical protein